jgi:hypothetical protein
MSHFLLVYIRNVILLSASRFLLLIKQKTLNDVRSEKWCLLGCYAMWLLQEPHGVTSQKTPFFIVTAVKTSSVPSGAASIRSI